MIRYGAPGIPQMLRKRISFRIRAVAIACTDQKRSERFYERILGARRQPRDGSGCAWFRLGELTLSLMPNATEPSPSKFPTHAMPIIWMEVVDLAEARRHLNRHKVPILEDEVQYLMVADPDGLLIEIWQSEPEAFELVQIPKLTAKCGLVRVTLLDTPFLRSSDAIEQIKELQAIGSDEPFDGPFSLFLSVQVMFRYGSYTLGSV